MYKAKKEKKKKKKIASLFFYEMWELYDITL